MTSLSESDLKNFHNALKDQPLEPSHPFYVCPFDNTSDTVMELARSIEWRDDASMNLVSGQRGSGKSTELRRLRQMLEQSGCCVFLCDMSGFINFDYPVEITDFLVSVLLAFSEAVREKYQDNPLDRPILQRVSQFLHAHIKITGINVGEENSSFFGLALKQDPDVKQKLQDALRSKLTLILQELSEFIEEVIELITHKNSGKSQKIVLLLDSIEQIRGKSDNAHQVHESVAILFTHHIEKLRLPKIHTVYTIPPYLPSLAGSTGDSSIYHFPNIHALHRSGELDENGVRIMEEILSKRFVNWESIVTAQQLRKQIIPATGGNLREFFRLLTVILRKINLKQLPVSDKIIHAAKNNLRADMLPIPLDEQDWLRRIAENKEANLPDNSKILTLARFLDNNLVQHHRNDSEWYDINPLLKDVILPSASTSV